MIRRREHILVKIVWEARLLEKGQGNTKKLMERINKEDTDREGDKVDAG